jgi:hypothetical protein
VAESALHQARLYGLAVPDQPDETQLAEVEQYLRDNPARFQVVLDHRSDLLDEAQRFAARGDLFKAILFYALHFEHAANYLLLTAAHLRDIPHSSAKSMVRAISLEAKMTWGLTVLGMPQLNVRHRRAILSVAEERNAYVHYKGPDIDVLLRGGPDRLEKLLVDGRKAVTYLRWFETRFLKRETVLPERP